MEIPETDMPSAANVSLRPAAAADREFLLDVYAASREIELAMVPWDAAQKRAFVELQFDAQLRHYETEYRDTKHDIILRNGQPAGRLFVGRGNPEQIELMDVTVLPAYRKNGIGTHIIRELQLEAAEAGKSLRVFVETFNPSQELFRKLGFEIVDDPGVNLRFEWRQAAKKGT